MTIGEFFEEAAKVRGTGSMLTVVATVKQGYPNSTPSYEYYISAPEGNNKSMWRSSIHSNPEDALADFKKMLETRVDKSMELSNTRNLG